MKRSLALGLTVSLIFVLTVLSGHAAWQKEWDMALSEAKKEGKLMIYSSPDSKVLRPLSEAFSKKYNIKVEFVIGRAEEIARKIEAEKGAGFYFADVLICGGGSLMTVNKPLGHLAKLEPLLLLPEVTDPNVWITGSIPFLDKDRTGIGMAATFQRYLLRNTDLVKEGEVTSYKDLLNPKWKGKMVLNDPTVTGTGKGFFTMLRLDIYGLEATKDFMRQFVKQEPAITRDRRLQAEWVSRGKYHLSVATDMATASRFIKMGAPLAYIKAKEGSIVVTGGAGLGVLAKAAHPNATKVFVNWLLSREGHAIFIKAFGNPGSRKDAPKEGIPLALFAEPDEKIYAQTEEFMLLGTEVQSIARDIFAPLLK